jgi:segregation and condensation protein B
VAALMPDELPLTDDGDSEDEEDVQESLALSDEGEEVAEAEDSPESEG